MTKYRLKSINQKGKTAGVYKHIERSFTDAFLKEDAESPSGYTLKTGKTGEKVIEAYHKIEDGVVGTYKKIENAFVDAFLEEDTDNTAEKKERI